MRYNKTLETSNLDLPLSLPGYNFPSEYRMCHNSMAPFRFDPGPTPPNGQAKRGEKEVRSVPITGWLIFVATRENAVLPYEIKGTHSPVAGGDDGGASLTRRSIKIVGYLIPSEGHHASTANFHAARRRSAASLEKGFPVGLHGNCPVVLTPSRLHELSRGLARPCQTLIAVTFVCVLQESQDTTFVRMNKLSCHYLSVIKSVQSYSLSQIND